MSAGYTVNGVYGDATLHALIAVEIAERQGQRSMPLKREPSGLITHPFSIHGLYRGCCFIEIFCQSIPGFNDDVPGVIDEAVFPVEFDPGQLAIGFDGLLENGRCDRVVAGICVSKFSIQRIGKYSVGLCKGWGGCYQKQEVKCLFHVAFSMETLINTRLF
jgi:hypothetical protein